MFFDSISNKSYISVSDLSKAARIAAQEHPIQAGNLRSALQRLLRLSNANQANSGLLQSVSDRIFSNDFVSRDIKNPALQLIGQYLPDPNAAWVKDLLLNNLDTRFASGVGSNQKFNPNVDSVKALIKDNLGSWFALGVGSNQKFDPNADWVQELVKNNPDTLFARGVGSNQKFDPNADWVRELVKNNPDTLFARGVGSNQEFDPNADWVRELLFDRRQDYYQSDYFSQISNLYTLFAGGVGSNQNLDLNADWVRNLLSNNLQSNFAFGVGSNQNLNLNADWVKHLLQYVPSGFSSGVYDNPRVRLKLILENDLPKIYEALKFNPGHPLKKMLAV